MILVMAIATVWLRLSIVRTSYSINEAERSIRKLLQEKEQLELKVTASRSPRRLEILAKTKFGLSQPRTDQVIRLSDGVKKDSVPVTAAAPLRAPVQRGTRATR